MAGQRCPVLSETEGAASRLNVLPEMEVETIFPGLSSGDLGSIVNGPDPRLFEAGGK